jgi:sodium/potassium-transporting ATPase subunit beta
MAADDVDFAGKGQKKGIGAKVRNCCNSIWNPQKKEFLGRTGSSWAKIGVFYVIFYSCLAGFFAIMLVGFFATLDERAPTMTKMYSLIKQNPGMGFRPMSAKDSTLIQFNSSDVETYDEDIADILAYLSANNYTDSSNHINNDTTDSDGNKIFNIREALSEHCPLNNDNLNNSFGYHCGQPCVLLKINRVFDWIPENFDNGTTESDFEKEAKQKITITNNMIGVSCEGENDGDIDNLGTPQFTPSGFSFEYYPYMNQKMYKAPIVFVRFPDVKPGVLIQVWCKLWVKNIKHHKNDKAGSVHFELLVDVDRDAARAKGCPDERSR